jgi:hypothetical protein
VAFGLCALKRRIHAEVVPSFVCLPLFGLAMLNALQCFLSWRYARLCCLLLAFVLVLPSLWAGFFADDFSHYVLLTQSLGLAQPDNLSLFHLFSFVDGNPQRSAQLMQQGLLPWWIAPDFSMNFWRPLSEFSHYLDYQLWPNSPEMMHFQSLLWYAAVLLLLNALYRRVLPAKLALLSLLFFVLDATHGFTLAWIANRNAWIAAAFALAAVLSFISWDRRGGLLSAILSAACIALAFAAGEIGISVGILLLAYSVVYSERSWWWRGLRLLPALMIFILWLVLYRLYDYGALGNKFYYADVFSEPYFYAVNFIPRFAEAFNMLFNPLPLHLLAGLKPWLIACGLLFFVLLSAYCYWRRARPVYFAYWVLVLAIIPVASAEMQERNLLFASFAASILLADVMLQLLAHSQRLWARLLAGMLICTHLLLSGLLLLPTSYAPKLLAQPALEKTTALQLRADEGSISFGLPIFEAVFISPMNLYQGGELAHSYMNISSAEHFRLSRLTSQQWLLSSESPLLGAAERLLRDFSSQAMYPEQIFMQGEIRLVIQAVDTEGVPTAMLIELPDGRSYNMQAFDGATLVNLKLDVGQSYQQ